MEDDADPWASGEGDFDISEIENILDHSAKSSSTIGTKDGHYNTIDAAKNNSRLRVEEQYAGFDGNVGQTWIYPNNLPCRSYQLSICQSSLYRNTLVVLPTGLGKTFIAAVVMYNLYRWYPTGKVLFMAPTRPLVAQQIQACHRIMPFPSSDIIDITGKVRREKRMEYWKTKRVFFATPQVVHADMMGQSELDEPFPYKDIKLIVIDEAHKARGRYAYTEVAQLLWRRNRFFRVLALSATPGRTVNDVAEVVRNLFISHLEVRWDNSIDVTAYVHKRTMKTVVVPLDEKIKDLRKEIIEIIDPYLRQLIDAGVLSGSHQNITRNFLLFEQKHFRDRSLHERHPDQAAVNTNFSICISLFHSLELLERHGLRVFINSFDDDEDGRQKFVITMNPALRDLVNRLRDELGPNILNISALNLTNGCLPELTADVDFGHPKFQRARECLLEHFEKNPESRAIVFCEYRESVMLIYRLLFQHAPLLKPRCFVGQGGTTGPLRALSQKQQIQIMVDFRSGKSNILIATSIGEEGIDVGEVDLIVCFDISTSNPTRFIQRIGRTGRQRQGYVVLLVTEGKEHQMLKEVLANKDQINKKILNSSIVKGAFYKESPRLVPTEYNPKCVQTFIKSIEPVEPPQETPTKQKKKKIKPKAIPAKEKVIQNSQDLRKFFTKANNKMKNAEEMDIFESPSTARPVITQRTAESCRQKVKNLFKGLNMDTFSDPNTQLLERENEKSQTSVAIPRLNMKKIRRINRLLKSSTDSKPISHLESNLLVKLRSKKFSRAGKLLFLKHYYNDIRQLFEKFDILQALEADIDMSAEEIEVRETCQEILLLFTDREALERFLEDSEFDSKIKNQNDEEVDEFTMSNKSFDHALDKIFSGLDPQGYGWDSFLYRQTQLKKTNGYKEFMAKRDEERNAFVCSVVFNGKPNESSTQFDEIAITDSKYCSQWIESVGETTASRSPVDTTTLLDDQSLVKPSIEQKKINVAKKLQNEFSALSGPLVKAFERQKDKERSRQDLETSLNKSLNNDSIIIEIGSDDDDDILNYKVISDNSLTEIADSTCDKSSCSPKVNSNIHISAKPEIEMFKDKVLQKTEPSKSIEKSFMLRQQSTPIQSKLWSENKPKVNDDSFQDALEINLEDFAEPFPEELDFLTEKLDWNSGSSFKKNAMPKNSPQTNQNQESDLFRLLEVKPTNSVITPKRTANIFNKSNDITPSTKTNSPKLNSPSTILDSPPARPNTSLATKSFEKSPSILCLYMKGLERLQRLKNSSTSTVQSITQENDSPIAPKRNREVNMKRKIIDSESESDATLSPVACNRDNSDSDFEEIPATQKPKRRRLTQQHQKRSRPARACLFFDQEADKSKGPGHTTDEDDYENTLNEFEYGSMVVDNTDESGSDDHNRPTATQMQAVYLQSLKSPSYQRCGGFKIPEPREFPIQENIYSQEVPVEQTQYDDSFVVDGEDDDTIQTTLCPLERAEKILKERKRKAKRRRFAEVGVVNPIRKRIRKCYQLQDDSDTSDGTL